MNQTILMRLSAITDEEQAILAGKPLEPSRYGEGELLTVSGQRLLPSSRMITLRPHTRFIAFPEHRHDYVEMLYMVTGQTVHHFPGKEPLILGAGDVLLMGRNAQHAIERCGEGDVGVNLIIQPAFLDEAQRAIGSGNALGRFLLENIKEGKTGLPYLHFRGGEHPSVEALMESIVCALASPKPTSQRILKTSITLLLMYMLEYTDHLKMPPSGGNELVVSLLEEIRHRYASVNLTEFARSHHVSAPYLSQTVRKATGLTPTQHLQRRRIDQAKKLLRDTDLSVTEVCYQVGYSNTSHFYQLFTQLCGMNPTEYRHVNSGREKP
ncbi:MAG: helix-turn-helix domain-containing protein [Clostridia bacterium]|nr:helix-turn-helix domain-containing protein [Clostridia bacterium]